MKKYTSDYIHSQKRTPGLIEIGQIEVRGKKDRQKFEWLVKSPRGRETVKMVRGVLGLPENGIEPITDLYFERLEDLPNFPSNEEVNWMQLKDYVERLQNLLQISERFYESLKSYLIFNRAVPAKHPVQVFISGTPSQQNLFLEVYSDFTTKDIKAMWKDVVILQQKLKGRSKIAWKIIGEKKIDVVNDSVLIKINSTTLLSDLDNKIFRDEVNKRFIKKKTFREWNFNVGIKLKELDANPNISDKDKADSLFSSGYAQDNIQKIRRIRHKSKLK